MVQSQGDLFMGNMVIFIDLAIDVVRFSSLTQDHTGSWRNSWQKSICLVVKWSFPETISVPQETSLNSSLASTKNLGWKMNRAIL